VLRAFRGYECIKEEKRTIINEIENNDNNAQKPKFNLGFFVPVFR